MTKLPPATPQKANRQLSIEQLPNLGPVSARILAAAGIISVDQLQRLGPVTAFRIVQASGARPSLKLLWALFGASRGLHWTKISPAEKAKLLRELGE